MNRRAEQNSELQTHFAYACGNLSAAAGRERSAMLYFRQEIRRTSYYKAYYDLAILLARRSRLTEAIRNYKEAARRSTKRTDRSDALNNLALVYARKGRDGDAIKALHEAIRQNPKSAAPRVNLALQLLRRGDRDGGRHWLERAYRLRRFDDTTETERWVGYGFIEYDIDIGRGVRILEGALEKNPADSTTIGDLAVGYMKLGHRRKAKRLAQRAKQLAHNNRDVAKQVGFVLGDHARVRASTSPFSNARSR